MKLANVSFKNENAGNLVMFYKLPNQFAGTSITVPGMTTSAELEGTLLTMDLVIDGTNYSVDLTNYLPNGVWVQDENPYRVKGILDKDGQHLLMHIADKDHEKVDEFKL